LPDYCSHIIKTDGFAKSDNFFANRNNLITSVGDRPGELIADINAKPASRIENSITFGPYFV